MFDEACRILADNPPGTLGKFFVAAPGSPHDQGWKDINGELIRNATNKYRACSQMINGCEFEGLKFSIPDIPEDDTADGSRCQARIPDRSIPRRRYHCRGVDRLHSQLVLIYHPQCTW